MLQPWMGYASIQMIMDVYSKLTKAEGEKDVIRLAEYMEQGYKPEKETDLFVSENISVGKNRCKYG